MTSPAIESKHVTDFAEFITSSPSSFHAAQEVARRLRQVGFREVNETESWPGDAGGYYLVRDGAIVAWILPEPTATSARIVGAHTDSPGLKLKPSASHYSQDGWGMIDVETYGGLLLNSWLDREIGFAGRIVDWDGNTHLVQTGAIARIPQLAIHLDRQVNGEGLKLDPQTHMQPIWTVKTEVAGDCILDFIARRAGLSTAKDVAGHDLISYATEAPQRFGANQEFFAAGRQDNLSSVHAGLVALSTIADGTSDFTVEDDPTVLMLTAFDHEEIGSNTRSGAAGPLLETVLRRIGLALGLTPEEYERFLAASSCMSADAGHFVHPNYAERHDPINHPTPGRGPLLKLNADQRYATDAVGSAIWARACRRAEVAFQAFVSNNSMPCGSTIGPITATRLGITTVDVGVGLLSMHSARELSFAADHAQFSRVLQAYLAGA